MPTVFGVLTSIIAAAGGLFLILCIRSLVRRRPIGAVANGGATIVFFSLFFVLVLISSHLYTYERLTAEQPVATISFERLAGRLFRASVALSDGRDKQYLIYGDEWQIDARILKWHGFAHLLGLDNYYRLERLSGRYSDIKSERLEPRSVYSLGKQAGWGVDLWNLAKDHKDWLPWVDAVYGSAAYMPMVHNSIYRVTLGPSGLVVRRLK